MLGFFLHRSWVTSTLWRWRLWTSLNTAGPSQPRWVHGGCSDTELCLSLYDLLKSYNPSRWGKNVSIPIMSQWTMSSNAQVFTHTHAQNKPVIILRWLNILTVSGQYFWKYAHQSSLWPEALLACLQSLLSTLKPRSRYFQKRSIGVVYKTCIFSYLTQYYM